MDVQEAMRRRRSVRRYDPAPIPDRLLRRVLEAGRLAPSAKNYQPWHFIVVRDEQKRERLARGKYAGFLKEAPLVIVGCGDKEKSPDWYVVDTTIALQQMVLAATGEGLGTCWVGSLDKDDVARALNLPRRFEVVAMLTLGYPKKELSGTDRPRSSMDRIVSEEEFGRHLSLDSEDDREKRN